MHDLLTERTLPRLLLVLLPACLFPLFVPAVAGSQTGSVHEPVRYVGGVSIDLAPHEGRLRPAVGVSNYQVLRANRTHPELAEDAGWTYNHAPMLAYWNERFYLQYLSNPVDEHIAPGQTLVSTSLDGRAWSKPEVVFPPYAPPQGTSIPPGYDGYMMHQRMGFYVAPDDRLLMLAFYGHAEDPFEKGGIGRVVREAYRDGTFGPIYFIRYSSHTKWDASNTAYPLYRDSPDKGFVEACEALLADKLMTLQWWEEDQGLDGFYGAVKGASAFNWYPRKDGKIVGLWKRSTFALSEDGGKTFSDPVKVPTLIMAGGKQWGQRTDDGRYAILYNPTVHDEHRYPLVAITGGDGIIFDDMVLVHSEVPPRRFFGRWKDYGPCYVRGIIEGNGNPPGTDLWVTYSVNKEDMWVSRVPVPVRHAVEESVRDDFQSLQPGGFVAGWNVYSPLWAPVGVVEQGNSQFLELSDADPYDYARAVRIFPESQQARVTLKVTAPTQGAGDLDMDLMDRYGNRPVRLRLERSGQIQAWVNSQWENVAAWKPGEWRELTMAVDASPYGHYSLLIDGVSVLGEAPLAEAVLSVERLSLRTGPFRTEPTRQTVNEKPHDPLPGADDAVDRAVFHVDDVLAGPL